jgi:hypothetical protein
MPFAQPLRPGGGKSLLVLQKVLDLSEAKNFATAEVSCLPSSFAVSSNLGMFDVYLLLSHSGDQSDAWVRTLTERFEFSCFVMLLSD